MALPLGIHVAPPVTAMRAFLEPHRSWLESMLGCPWSEVLTFELDFPFSHLVVEDLLCGVELDHRCLAAAKELRLLVTRWTMPPDVSPRIELHPSKNRASRIGEGKLAWDPHWKETPLALWFGGLSSPLVTASIPYLSYRDRTEHRWRQWVLVKRGEVAPALTMLRSLAAKAPRKITVIGGRDIPLPQDGYDWDSVILAPALNPPLRSLLPFDFCALPFAFR